MVSDERRAVPDGWVPVEDRWWGLDRRSLLPAAVIVLVGLVMTIGLPLLDRSTTDHEVVRDGDRLNLGQGLTITPPVGWQIVDGIKVTTTTTVPLSGAARAVVTDGGVTVTIQVDTFSGDARTLLKQVNKTESRLAELPDFRVTGKPGAVTATGGITGFRETYTTTSGQGILAAFVVPDGRGISVLATGAGDGQLSQEAGRVKKMLSSIRLNTAQQGSQP